jgi:hypothetical protein
MMTGQEFAECIAEVFTEEECENLFAVSRESLADFSVKWNESLEYYYNETISEEETEDEIRVGYEDNCPCDTTGFCGGTSCPRFFQCQQ